MQDLEFLFLRPRPSQEVWNKDVIHVVNHPVPGTLPLPALTDWVPLVQTVQTSHWVMSGQPQDCRQQVHHV